VTLTLANFFGLLGGLLVLAYVANRLSRRTRVPDVVVLLASGIILGPVLHWINADHFPQVIRGVGTLALILILFAAGLELDLRAWRQFISGTVLAILSYALTMAGVTLFCMNVLAMPRMAALLVSAALACMSGSIVLPILDQLDLRRDLKTTLVIEASFGDGLGALVVGVLIGLASGGVTPKTSGGEIFGGVVALFVFRFLLGFVIAVVAGFLWARLLPHISNKQFWQVLTFAAVLIVYSGTHAVGGSDLFAVMVFGATLASLLDPKSFLQDFGFEILTTSQSTQIHSFHSELAFLVRSFFFVLLGAMIQFKGLQEQLLPSLGILCVFLIARYIAVTGSRVAWRNASSRERELACVLIPRGLITAVLALEVIVAMPKELEFLPALTFALILFTNFLVLIASIRAKALAVGAEEGSPVAALPQR
jgi:NhaP-type Na+/H+ or K+/H+ antiporter